MGLKPGSRPVRVEPRREPAIPEPQPEHEPAPAEPAREPEKVPA